MSGVSTGNKGKQPEHGEGSSFNPESLVESEFERPSGEQINNPGDVSPNPLPSEQYNANEGGSPGGSETAAIAALWKEIEALKRKMRSNLVEKAWDTFENWDSDDDRFPGKIKRKRAIFNQDYTSQKREHWLYILSLLFVEDPETYYNSENRILVATGFLCEVFQDK